MHALGEEHGSWERVCECCQHATPWRKQIVHNHSNQTAFAKEPRQSTHLGRRGRRAGHDGVAEAGDGVLALADVRRQHGRVVRLRAPLLQRQPLAQPLHRFAGLLHHLRSGAPGWFKTCTYVLLLLGGPLPGSFLTQTMTLPQHTNPKTQTVKHSRMHTLNTNP